jgi:hypothetical protein
VAGGGHAIPELRRLFPGGVNGLGESVPNKYFINILADFKPEEAPPQVKLRRGHRDT